MYAHNNHYQWIEKSLNIKCSELGKDVANILGFVGRGIYNCPINHEKTDWTHPEYIEIVWYGYLSNYDFSQLTELLIECFERMIRITINPHSFKYLKFQFWKRKTRDMSKDMYLRLPTLEYMIYKQNELFRRTKNE